MGIQLKTSVGEKGSWPSEVGDGARTVENVIEV